MNLSSASSLEDLRNMRVSKASVASLPSRQSALEPGWSREELEELGLGDLMARLNHKRIEQVVGYTFREKSFLLQAFTHPSFLDDRGQDLPQLTESYEQLEWLGDAVLGYIITRHLNTKTEADYKKLKFLRSFLLSNAFFAAQVVSLFRRIV